MATITQTSTVITINGAYKDFTGGSGSTTTVIQYSSGDAPVSGDAGRFLMWKVTAGQTGTWQIRYIESATSTTVTVGDGGFSSGPIHPSFFHTVFQRRSIVIRKEGRLVRAGVRAHTRTPMLTRSHAHVPARTQEPTHARTRFHLHATTHLKRNKWLGPFAWIIVS